MRTVHLAHHRRGGARHSPVGRRVPRIQEALASEVQHDAYGFALGPAWQGTWAEQVACAQQSVR